MSGKKKGTEEVKIRLGRPGNHLKMGIVGLPNVGKSTMFNVLTNMAIPAENFPFCTIDPNESRCAVPDDRFDVLCKEFKPAKEIPAYLSVNRNDPFNRSHNMFINYKFIFFYFRSQILLDLFVMLMVVKD